MIVVFAAGGLADIFTVRASILMSGCITIAIALFSFRVLHKSLENVKHTKWWTQEYSHIIALKGVFMASILKVQ